LFSNLLVNHHKIKQLQWFMQYFFPFFTHLLPLIIRVL